ncbi:hypothetical protein TIFTF001_021743 [Ficus carica]|uniref:Uncharacterized protein n=1 Tax=Ficus carica TaxID=3494 RepID=A0AA88AZ16_FICCA|nr:hypothetical protein TIFTF001_021743 [Ficus carica]
MLFEDNIYHIIGPTGANIEYALTLGAWVKVLIRGRGRGRDWDLGSVMGFKLGDQVGFLNHGRDPRFNQVLGPRMRFVSEYRVKIGFQDHESDLGVSRARYLVHGAKFVFELSRILGFGIEKPTMIMSLTPVPKPNPNPLPKT